MRCLYFDFSTVDPGYGVEMDGVIFEVWLFCHTGGLQCSDDRWIIFNVAFILLFCNNLSKVTNCFFSLVECYIFDVSN